MSRWRITWRGLRLRCPHCGEGKLFRGWFAMHDRCEHCGFLFGHEPGFFLGSIYINYGLTTVLVLAGYFACFFLTTFDPNHVLIGLLVFSVLFPLWFFRYARSLWLGFDYAFDPKPPGPQAGQKKTEGEVEG